MPVNLTHVHHVGIFVSDMERSRSFYDKLFGVKPTVHTRVANSASFSRALGAELEEGDADIILAFYDLGNTAVELLQAVWPKLPLHQVETVQPGSKHLCFRVDDLHTTYDSMISEGYIFAAPICTFTDQQPDLNGVKFAYFLDPDGNTLEIMEDRSRGSAGAA